MFKVFVKDFPLKEKDEIVRAILNAFESVEDENLHEKQETTCDDQCQNKCECHKQQEIVQENTKEHDTYSIRVTHKQNPKNTKMDQLLGLEGLFAVPGCSKEEINVQLYKDNLVVIEYPNYFPPAENQDTPPLDKKVLKQYKFEIPENYDVEKIETSLKNGLLTLFFPYNPEKQVRKIEIK